MKSKSNKNQPAHGITLEDYINEVKHFNNFLQEVLEHGVNETDLERFRSTKIPDYPEWESFKTDNDYLLAVDAWCKIMVKVADIQLVEAKRMEKIAEEQNKKVKQITSAQKKKEVVSPSLSICHSCPAYWNCKIKEQGFILCPRLMKLNNETNEGGVIWYTLNSVVQKEKIRLN